MCLLERLEHELNSSDFDNGTGANRLLGIFQLLATVTVPVHEESSEESESFGEIRRTALEKAIVLLQEASSFHNLLNTGCNDHNILALLRLEKTLLEVNKPLLTSQCEALLLRTSTLLRLDSIISQSNVRVEVHNTSPINAKQFFKEAWLLICEILSSALFKRPSYLVKSRVPLVVSIFRNLLFGLVAVSDHQMFDLSNDKSVQEKYPLDTQDLEQMSHNLDRCLDHIRGDKLKEDFARVAPYMVADILEAAFAGKVTVVQTVKNNLLTGMFKLLDICAKHSVDYLLNTLPLGQRDVFKEILGNYKQYHKYSGKV